MPSRLIKAVHTGDIALARKKLEAGRNPNQLDEHKIPLIHYPIMQDNPEMLKLLLEHGADPNIRWTKTIKVKKEFTPLKDATSMKRKTIVNLLLEYGASAGAKKTRKAAAAAAEAKSAKSYTRKAARPLRNNLINQIVQNIANRNQTVVATAAAASPIEHNPNMNKVVAIKETKRRAKKQQKVNVQKGNVVGVAAVNLD